MGPWLSQTLFYQGTCPPGYRNRRFLKLLGYPRRCFIPVLGPWLTQTPFPQGTRPFAMSDTVSSMYCAFWLSQTPFVPDTRPNGYPNLIFLQEIGSLAIIDAPYSRYWVPGYHGRRFLQVLYPLANLNAVSSSY